MITCLQSDVSTPVSGSDQGNRLPLSDRRVPLRTAANGTLMARDLRAEGLAARPRPDASIIAEDPAGHLPVSVGGFQWGQESARTQTILWTVRLLACWIQGTHAHHEPSRSCRSQHSRWLMGPLAMTTTGGQ
jgi:hypothetical protein